MNINDLDRLRSEAIYLNDVMSQMVDDADTDWSDEDTQRAFTEGKWLRDALIAEGIALTERAEAIAVIEDNVRTASVISGDGSAGTPAFHRDVDPYDEETIRTIGVDEAFKRAVGDSERRVDADGCEELERKARLEFTDPQHMSGFREYVLALGSEDYARGWFKKVTGQSHLMNDAERAADERAHRAVTQRSVAIASDAAGAALVPIHLDPTVILTNDGAANPFRQVSKTVSIMQNVWNGVSSAGVSFTSSTEGGDTTDGAPVFLDPAITCAKAHCTIPISFEAYDDIANVGQIVAGMFADAKANYENAKFATGSGTNEPIGIVTALAAAGVGRQYITATNSAFGVSDLTGTQNKLGARWQDRAVWAANIAVHNAFRLLGDEYYGETVNLAEGFSSRLLGRPAFQASGMSGTISNATNNSAVYGDFSNYVIVDRVGMSIEFIPNMFSAAAAGILPNGKRAWHAWYRVGADSVNDTGFVMLVNRAT